MEYPVEYPALFIPVQTINSALLAGFHLHSVILSPINRNLTPEDRDKRKRDCPDGLVTGVLSSINPAANVELPMPTCEYVRPGWFFRYTNGVDSAYLVALYKPGESHENGGQLEWKVATNAVKHPNPDYDIILAHHKKPPQVNKFTRFTWERYSNYRQLKHNRKLVLHGTADRVAVASRRLHSYDVRGGLHLSIHARNLNAIWELWSRDRGPCINLEHDAIMNSVLAMPGPIYRIEGSHLWTHGDQVHLLDPTWKPPAFSRDDGAFPLSVESFQRLYPDPEDARLALRLKDGTGHDSHLSADEYLTIFGRCARSLEHNREHPIAIALEFPTGYLDAGYGSRVFNAPVVPGAHTILALNDDGGVDHSATLSTCGSTTDFHFDYAASEQMIVVPDDATNRKIWGLLPATAKNYGIIAAVVVNNNKKYRNGTFMDYANNLEGFIVRYVFPGDTLVIPPGVLHAVLGISTSCHIGCRILSTARWHEAKRVANLCLTLYGEAYAKALAYHQNHTIEAVPDNTLSELRSATNHWELAAFTGEWYTLIKLDRGRGLLRDGDIYRVIHEDISDIFDLLAQYISDIGANVGTFNPDNEQSISHRLSFFKTHVRVHRSDVHNAMFN